MNRENIKAVRDHLAQTPRKRFAMSSYFGVRTADGDVEDNWDALQGRGTNAGAVEGSCQTCACIAGHTMAALRPRQATPRDTFGAARRLLGLSEVLAGKLFEPNNNDAEFKKTRMTLGGITRPHAVRVLDHLLETGQVDWVGTRRAKKAADAPVEASPRQVVQPIRDEPTGTITPTRCR